MSVAARLATLCTLALLAAVPAASANHSFPATYSGTYSGGGTISFQVSADGNTITVFERSAAMPYSCGASTVTESGKSTWMSIPITNHAFNHNPSTGTHVSGSFSASQQASGTIGVREGGAFPCSGPEWTWTASTTAPPPGPPPGPPPPPGPGIGGPDSSPPPLGLTDLSASRRGVTVEAACGGEACNVTARGTVSVPKAAKVFRLRAVSASIPAGGSKVMRLRVPKAAARPIKRALARRKRVLAKLTVSAVDAAGNRTTKTRTIRVR